MRRIVFLGGNGHCDARIAAARRALAAEGVQLDGARYPGFEGRPRARDLDGFLGAVSEEMEPRTARAAPGLIYATGIGALVALGLRARGECLDVPLLLQAPVLWGLRRRWMPRLMRLPAARAGARRLFASGPFQRRFVRRHFTRAPSLEMRTAFFDGYAACQAFEDLFAWLTPAWLCGLEEAIAARPVAVENVRVWWGGRDRVVTPRELAWTEEALGMRWPLVVFPEWGHYPTIDEPVAWARAVGAEYGD